MKKYIKLILLLSISLITHSAKSQTSEIIDNAKLIELAKEKLGDDLIIGFIKSSPTKFDCGLSDILKLKKAGVSESVLAEVMKVCNSNKTTKVDENNTNNPEYQHPAGIYVYDKQDSGFTLKKTYATVVTQEKSGGLGENIKSTFTFGLSKKSVKASINGKNANLKCNTDATFYFYFDQNSKEASLSNWWFSNASSPNEFTLLKLTQTEKSRQFEKGKSDSYTFQSGLDEKQKVEISFEEIKPSLFKVKTKQQLTEGEYCFLYSATVPSQFSNDKVFDFSVVKSQ